MLDSPYDRIRKEFYARKESRRTASSSEHLRFFETADTLFKDLPGAVEFIDDRLQEVLVVFGDSLLSPKEIYVSINPFADMENIGNSLNIIGPVLVDSSCHNGAKYGFSCIKED